jgi:predicted amidophosphoribosyltransferase
VSCGAFGQALCDCCLDAIRPIVAPICARCGAPVAWPVERCRECAGRRIAFASARAAYAYSGPVRPFVRRWKEGGLRPLATLAAGLVAGQVARPAADVITYIPPDGDRSLRRGHHPAEGLARELGRLWGMEVVGLLVRARHVSRQTGLSRAERRVNVRGAFAAVRPVRGVAVLVDDVYTTGATANDGASALRRAGAARVEVVSLARAVR